MRNPMLSIVVVLALVLPLAGAHLTNPSGSATSQLFTGDNCRLEGSKPVCTGTDGLSGTYVTGNDYAIESPTLYPYSDFWGLWIPPYNCDLEVLSDGQSPSAVDEGMVNGGPGGAVPDGTWDDGGYGIACHHLDRYQASSYNSENNCSGTAYAKDRTSGGRVWVWTGCDSATYTGYPGFTLCMTRAIQYNPTASEYQHCLQEALDFGSTIINLPTISCGPDGIVDNAYYGAGAVGIPIPDPRYHWNNYSGCSDGDAYVGVMSYVREADLSVVPATAGWIEQRLPPRSSQAL